MAKLLKLRRGTTSQHGSFTGAEGEVTVDTDKETLVVHNNNDAAGFPLAREDMSNVSSASIAGRLGTDSIATTKIAAGALPTDVTVASANIVDGTIVNGDVNASAAIAGTKVTPAFGSQNLSTTGTAATGALTVTGDVGVTGNVDGVDIAARDTLFGGLTSSSGALTNGVTATTQSASDNSTKVATTAYTDTAITNLVDSSPAALNTLNELAAALGDDANFSTTVTNSIATKLATNGNGSSVTNLNASNLASGTIPDARFPSTLPAVSGANLTGIVSFVSGMIIMYNSASAPSGWYLCDGNNGTPDLRDRFIVGAGNSYSQGATGGSNTATDNVSISGSDTVSISVSVSGTTGGPSGQAQVSAFSLGNTGSPRPSNSHTHSFSGSGSDTVNISGSDTVSIDTRSPYYALTFIMKA